MAKQVFKNHQSEKWSIAAKSLLLTMILLLSFTTLTFAEGGGRYHTPAAVKVGIMADTQWTVSDDPEGVNPHTVSAALAGVIQQELADKGAELVIQLGDLSDGAGNDAVYARADAAQPLIDTGIGFWPLRGNHETYGYSFYGTDPDHDMDLPAYIDAYPQLTGQGNLLGATNISSPSDIYGEDLAILDGLSYSFDYGPLGSNARFVIVDVEQTVYSEVLPEPHPLYGDPYTYIWFTVYQVDFPVEGVTTTYDSAAVPVEVDKEITIEPGTWFRIDSHGRPSTNMYAWDEPNPDQEGFDFNWPLDEWVVPQQPSWSAAGSEFWPGTQQDWIDERLDIATRGTAHAFVLSHRGLMGANHVDCFFGSNPGSKSSQQNPFYASLADNGVQYMLSGHDHLHNRALVDSPDGLSQVQQIIHMAASTKFYTPASLDSFTSYYGPVKEREAPISQEIKNVGYYLMTIDGPRVIVDYYSDANNGFQDGDDYPYGPDDPVNPPLFLPDLDFALKESYGYSHNGQQYVVAQGGPYTVVQETYGNTTTRILDGTNNSTATDATPEVIDDNDTPEDPSDDIIESAPRPYIKTVNTGWVDNPGDNARSDIFSLIGMADLGSDQTDTFVLEMNGEGYRRVGIRTGRVAIATYVNGEWVNAVSENFGGTPSFVMGPYAGQGLGTYGFDPATDTFWCVVNYNADFVVADVERIM